MSFGSGADRRQFGRRGSDVKAYAVLPGQVMLPCLIENVSDGGALLRFSDGTVPAQSFRLVVEGTDFNILCDVRHAEQRRVGVRFVRLAEGIALNRHLQRTTKAPSEVANLIASPARVERERSVPSVRQLRQALLAPREPAPGSMQSPARVPAEHDQPSASSL